MSSKELTTLFLSLAMDWLNREKGIDSAAKSKAYRILGFSASRGHEFSDVVSPSIPFARQSFISCPSK